MSFALVIVALILLVVVHELGHFLAARAVGVRATKFYVFFPPALFKRKIGEVEYGIGAIPAGGFVKLPGMFPPQPGEVSERLGWEYEKVLPLVDGDDRLVLDAARRSIAHADGPDGLLAPLGEVRDVLARVAADAPEKGDARATLDSSRERVEALLDDAHPQAYWRASLWRRMTVIFAGPFVNLVVALVVLTGFYAFWIPTYEITEPFRLGGVEQGSPAAEAGLTKQSRITGWNGDVVGTDVNDFNERVVKGVGKPIRMSWRTTDGDEVTKTITPRRLDGDGAASGDGEDRPRIGVLLPRGSQLEVQVSGREGIGVWRGLKVAGTEIRQVTWGNLSRLPRVFFDKEIREDVGSVVGIVQVSDEVDQAGQILRYVGVISLILAVMNLLPLLPLDGGHLLFGLLEAVRRRPMPRAAFERYSMVGLALVLLLFFIGLDNDIGRARG
ncbi:MAG: peptidase [Thermoleophilia bacterium]|nr:peptidase [Thermoleophilia bacterium]